MWGPYAAHMGPDDANICRKHDTTTIYALGLLEINKEHQLIPAPTPNISLPYIWVFPDWIKLMLKLKLKLKLGIGIGIGHQTRRQGT